MNMDFSESFAKAFINVMPQLGVQDVKLMSKEDCNKHIDAPGVVCIIGVIGDLQGNVIFALHEDCGKRLLRP